MKYDEDHIKKVTDFIAEVMRGRAWRMKEWSSPGWVTEVPSISFLIENLPDYELKPEPRMVQLWKFSGGATIGLSNTWTVEGHELPLGHKWFKVGQPFIHPEDV